MPSFTWDHVHLRTPDPEATAQWFERMFGAEVIRSTQQGKPRIDIKLGGAMIFTAQVNPGGRIFAVVGDAPAMVARIIRNVGQDSVTTHDLFETVIEPLRNAAHAERFQF